MSKYKMISPKVPNVPWQERPAELNGAPVWRYKENPIIGRNPVKGVARIFNSAVMPYGDEFIGVFRGEQTNGIPYIYLGRSKDAIHWNFEENKINFVDENGESFMPVYAYDPRLVKVEDTYYIIWCQDFYGAAIGMAKTTDFKTFTRIENRSCRLTGMRCCSRARSAAISCCSRDRPTAATHRSAIFLSVRVRISPTGENTVM